MNLRRLQAFSAVFESGSVTNAAQRLHMTQPAVSRLIRDLEKELGLALFERQQQRLIPSDEGRVFFREAERALAAVDQVVGIARDIRLLHGAHLRVVAQMIAAFGIAPAAIKVFLTRHPRAHVSLEIKDARDIVDWITSGPFDVGLSIAPLNDPRVEWEQLATVPCVLAIPKIHPFAKKRFVSLKDLAGEQMVLPSLGNPNRDLFAAAFDSAHLSYVGAVQTPSALSACQLVAEGLGLAVVDSFTFAAASRLDIVARPIRPAIKLSFGLFFPANRPRSALVNAFVQSTRTAIGSSDDRP
jgi:DNA-binding transcriptional LysR family regulator